MLTKKEKIILKSEKIRRREKNIKVVRIRTFNYSFISYNNIFLVKNYIRNRSFYNIVGSSVRNEKWNSNV